VLLDDWAGGAGKGTGIGAFAGGGCFGISGWLCSEASGVLDSAAICEVAFVVPLLKGNVPRAGLISSTANDTDMSLSYEHMPYKCNVYHVQ
jgi:hypothetical protein